MANSSQLQEEDFWNGQLKLVPVVQRGFRIIEMNTQHHLCGYLQYSNKRLSNNEARISQGKIEWNESKP